MREPEKDLGTESRILVAALATFARKGKDGARTQEIADAAGINKAMLHYYFRSKDRLYEAVFAYVFGRLSDTVGPGLRQATDFHSALDSFVEGYLRFVAENLDVMRFLVNENLSGGERLGMQIRSTLESDEPTVPRLMFRHIAEAVRRGEIRPVDPLQVLLSLLSECIFPFILLPTLGQIRPEITVDRAAFLSERRVHVVELMYRGLKASPS
jgi:TetR/AcrR family transcriptional regulator